MNQNENQPPSQLRKSNLLLRQPYFWTDTIRNWDNLLVNDHFKGIIIDSWKYLVRRNKIAIYAFVIMPNHLHIVWEMLDNNGKELPHGSFNKFTAHQFLLHLRAQNPDRLMRFIVKDHERNHRFWQRDPLAVLMDSKKKVEQKIDYIHLNPLQEKWNLAEQTEDYKWSSAKFYESGIDEFGILTHYMDRF